MQTHYFYTAIITFSVGVGVATFLEISPPVLIWFTLMALVSLLFWYRSKISAVEIKGWLMMFAVLLAFILGVWRTELAESKFGNSQLADEVGEKITINGIVAREPDRRENSLRLFVKTGEDLILVTTDRYALVTYGDEVKVEGKLSTPENFVTEFGRIFNYSGYLLAQGAKYQIPFAQVEVTDSNLGNPLISKLLIFKSAFMVHLEKVIAEPAVGLGEGLLLGVKQALGEELEDAFRETGIIHIVVLSGYNVMLVVAFVMFVLGYFLSVRLRVIAGIMAIISFALLVGLSATVVRASIMASILLIAQATGRIYLVLRVLLFAGFIMLLFNPLLLIYDVGFQLSFLATLGLILFAPILEQYFSKVPSFAGMRLFLAATIATQIAVLPLLLYQIGQLSMVAIVVNLLVLPMVPIAMLFTFATGMLGFIFPILAWLMAFPTYWSLAYINNLALWFADLPVASFVVPTFAFYIVPISYFIMGIIWWRLYKPEHGMGYGELTEQLIKVNDKNIEVGSENTTNTFDWIIEEEKDEINTKGSDAKRPTLKEDIPIFFR